MFRFLFFTDKDGNMLDSRTSILTKTNKKSVCTLSADAVPDGCKYVSVEVLNAAGDIIGDGLL